MPTFITPYSGVAELTASNGLEIIEQNSWAFSQAGFNDGATFGVSLSWPPMRGSYDYGADTRDTGFTYGSSPNTQLPGQQRSAYSGLLHLRAQNWTIGTIGNSLTSYYSPELDTTFGPDRCRITVTGYWQVLRQENSNSYNSFGTVHDGLTQTDHGDREMMPPSLLSYASPKTTYIIQGSSVQGGASDTFSAHEFWCKITETATSVNSNFEFQSNTIARPTWIYSYKMSWQID